MHPTTYLIVVGDADDADDEPTTSRARASATRPQRRDVIDRTPSTALHRDRRPRATPCARSPRVESLERDAPSDARARAHASPHDGWIAGHPRGRGRGVRATQTTRSRRTVVTLGLFGELGFEDQR